MQMKNGGEHEFATAGFPFGSDIGDGGCDARPGANRNIGSCAGQRRNERRIDPGPYRFMVSSSLSLV
jgi:hypothetical protein